MKQTDLLDLVVLPVACEWNEDARLRLVLPHVCNVWVDSAAGSPAFSEGVGDEEFQDMILSMSFTSSSSSLMSSISNCR